MAIITPQAWNSLLSLHEVTPERNGCESTGDPNRLPTGLSEHAQHSPWDANKGVANFLEKAAGNRLLNTNLPPQVRKKGKFPKQLPIWFLYTTHKLTSLNRVAPLLLLLLFSDTQLKLRLVLSPPMLLLLHHILMQCFCSWEKDG